MSTEQTSTASNSPAPASVAPASGGSVWVAWVGMTARSVWRAGWEIYEDGRPLMAAALAFRTVFSLLPIFVIGFVLLRAVSGTDRIVEDTIKNVLELTGLSNVVIEAGASDPGAGADADSESGAGQGWSDRDESAAFETPPAAGGELDGADPSSSASSGGVGAGGGGAGAAPPDSSGGPAPAALQDWILDVVRKAQRIDFSAIGLVGVLMLAYAAMSLVVEMEQSFNRLCGVNRGRTWVRRFQHYWLLLTVGPPMLALSFAAQQWLLGLAEKLQTVTGATVGSVVVGLSGVLMPLALSWLLLLMLYSTIPTVRLRPSALAVGSAAAAVLLEAGKYGFSQYLHMSTGYVTLYKSLALIPLFLLWVYVMWVIVLSGLKLSFVMHQAISTRELGPIGNPEPAFDGPVPARPERSFVHSVSSAWDGDTRRLFEPSITLVVMARAAEAFARGRTLEVLSEGAVLGLGHTTMRRILDALEEAGYLVRVVRDSYVAGGGGASSSSASTSRERFVLAKPASAVDLRGVLEVGYSLCHSDLPGRAGAAVEALRRSGLAALGDRTLDSLVVSQPSGKPPAAAEDLPIGPGVVGNSIRTPAGAVGGAGVGGAGGEVPASSGSGEGDTLRLRLKGTAEGRA